MGIDEGLNALYPDKQGAQLYDNHIRRQKNMSGTKTIIIGVLVAGAIIFALRLTAPKIDESKLSIVGQDTVGPIIDPTPLTPLEAFKLVQKNCFTVRADKQTCTLTADLFVKTYNDNDGWGIVNPADKQTSYDLPVIGMDPASALNGKEPPRPHLFDQYAKGGKK